MRKINLQIMKRNVRFWKRKRANVYNELDDCETDEDIKRVIDHLAVSAKAEVKLYEKRQVEKRKTAKRK